MQPQVPRFPQTVQLSGPQCFCNTARWGGLSVRSLKIKVFYWTTGRILKTELNTHFQAKHGRLFPSSVHFQFFFLLKHAICMEIDPSARTAQQSKVFFLIFWFWAGVHFSVYTEWRIMEIQPTWRLACSPPTSQQRNAPVWWCNAPNVEGRLVEGLAWTGKEWSHQSWPQ